MQVVWTVVVAAGSGQRFGGRKQFVELDGSRVLDLAITAARAVSTGVVAVVPNDLLARLDAESIADRVVAGGDARAKSVRAGLAAVPKDAEIVVVHDAARPLATVALFRAVVDAVSKGADGAVPGLLLTDTVKRVEGARVVETIDRSALVAVQTPQAFRAAVLVAAHRDGEDGTDDAVLVEALGYEVVVVPGERENIKLTEESDVMWAEAILRLRRSVV